MLFPVVEVTRSLSNLIKYTFVNFDKEDSYVIDYEKKEKPVEEPELQMTQVPDPEGFEAGVPVKNFDQVWEEKQEEAREQARVVLEEADKEAAQILEQARQEADDVRQQAFDQGFEEGKAEGIRRGQSEIENEKNEILQEKEDFRKQYEDTMAQMEPKFADVLCTLLQKLTGVLVSDQREVLTYLIHRTMMDMEPSSKFVLRVSTEDFPYMEAHKEEILMKAGVDAAVEVQEEKSLKDGECIIETDSQMIDCSFHTQLKNMTDTLRLLAQSH